MSLPFPSTTLASAVVMPASKMDDLGDACHAARLLRQLAHVVNLKLDCPVVHALAELLLHRRPHRAVDQGGGKSTMHHLLRIVEGTARNAFECDTAVRDINKPDVQQIGQAPKAPARPTCGPESARVRRDLPNP